MGHSKIMFGVIVLTNPTDSVLGLGRRNLATSSIDECNISDVVKNTDLVECYIALRTSQLVRYEVLSTLRRVKWQKPMVPPLE